MTKVVGVRFRNSGRVYYFDPLDYEIGPEDGVIVETARGTEYGDVAMGITEVPDEEVVQPLKAIVRVATEQDKAMRQEYMAKEPEAFELCRERIERHKLDMKLVDVEYTFNGSKVLFYFTADERVDFRELVKDLAACFKTRIELRQIGVRDEAKLLGGLGPCGRPVCCKEFLDDFRPVSIKMAKEQSLSLSPTKISGMCGRLMCCLQYEQNVYDEMKKVMPKTGKEIQTPDGNGFVMENNAITGMTKVKRQLQDGTFEQCWYHYTEVAKPGDPAPKARETETKESQDKKPESRPTGGYVPVVAPAAGNGTKKDSGENKNQSGRGAQRGASSKGRDRKNPGNDENREQKGADKNRERQENAKKAVAQVEPQTAEAPQKKEGGRRKSFRHGGKFRNHGNGRSDKPKNTSTPES